MEDLVYSYSRKIFEEVPQLLAVEFLKELAHEIKACKRRVKDVIMEWCYWHNLKVNQTILEFCNKILKSCY